MRFFSTARHDAQMKSAGKLCRRQAIDVTPGHQLKSVANDRRCTIS